MFGRNKKLAALIVVAVMLIAMAAPVYGAPSDVSGHWASGVISKWVDGGLVGGYDDGTFKPEKPISRAEFVVLLNNIFKFTDKSGVSFTDVPQTNGYADVIYKAAAAGIVEGDGGKFLPGNKISRQEAAVMIGRAFDLKATNANAGAKFSDSSSIASWGMAAVSALVEKRYIEGRGGNLFAPKANITRAEAVKMLDNVMGELENKAGAYTGNVAGNVVVNTPNVTLRNMTIAGDLIIAQGVGNGDVTLDGVTVKGRTLVKGGGENSIVLNNTSLTGTLIVIKKDGKVRIVAKGSTEVANTQIQNGAKLEEDGTTGKGFSAVEVIEVKAGTSLVLDGNFEQVVVQAPKAAIEVTDGTVGKLEVKPAAADATVKVTSGTVAELNVEAKAAVTVAGGTVGKLDVKQTAADTSVKITSGTVTEVKVQAKAAVSVTGGTVTTVNVASTAAQATLDVASTAKVTTLTADAAIAVKGTGTITTANINVSGVTMETKPTAIVAPATVTVTVAGQTTQGSTTTTNTNTGNTSGNTSGSSGNAIAVSDISLLMSDNSLSSLNIQSKPGTDRMAGIVFTTNVSATELNLTAINSTKTGIMAVDKKLSFSGTHVNISIESLLGALAGSHTSISLETLRDFCGNQVTVIGTLTGTGAYSSYTSYPVSVTITLGTGENLVPSLNSYFTVSYNSTSRVVTAEIVNTNASKKLTDLKTSGMALVTELLGYIPDQQSELPAGLLERTTPSVMVAGGSTWYTSIDNRSALKDEIEHKYTKDLDTATLADLAGMSFICKRGTDITYTINIVNLI